VLYVASSILRYFYQCIFIYSLNTYSLNTYSLNTYTLNTYSREMTASEKIPSGKNGKKKERKQMWVKVCDCYSRDQERTEKQSGQEKASHETGRTI
jgi:hypothetical protein